MGEPSSEDARPCYPRSDAGPLGRLLHQAERDLEQAEEPSYRRAAAFDLPALLVPAEALVYTLDEWNALLRARTSRKGVPHEVVWVYLAQ